MVKVAIVLGAMCLCSLSWVATAGAATTPSFDCDEAKADVDRLICGDSELAALDVKLAKAFATALARAPAGAVGDLKASQKAWHQQLLKCGKAGDPRQCVVKSYNDRLGSL